MTRTDDAIVEELRAIAGSRNVLTDARDCAPFLEEWRGYRSGRALAVVLPGSVEEVAAVLRLADANDLAVTPQGGNTGLSFGAVPPAGRRGIVIALRRMNALREIDRASNVIVVEAGQTLAGVHALAAQVGRTVPLHLGSEGTAQIGGLVSTNAGGTGAIRYGPMRDLVCGIEVVLPDGRILRDLGALRKNNTGYDLKHLFVAAEGTLGIVTAVALRMHPAMAASAHAWIALGSCRAAVDMLTRLQDRFDTAIMAAELVSGNEVDLVVERIPRSRVPFERTPAWSLMVELGAPDASVRLSEALEELLAAAFEEGVAEDAVIAQNSAQAQDIWHVRHSVSEANKLAGHSLSHDVAVRPSRVPDLIEECTARIDDLYPRARTLIVAHIGDGNVHFIVHFAHEEWARLPDPDATTLEVMTLVHDAVARLGGTFSAEHGIGRKLNAEIGRLIDPTRLDVMRAIKRTLDPGDRMNPGVLFPG